MIGAIITVLFIVAVLYLAYRRLPLLVLHLAFTVLLLAYSALGAPAGLVAGPAVAAAGGFLAAEPAAAAHRADQRAVHADLPAAAADDVRYRARRARGRHGMVGRGAVHRAIPTGANCTAPRRRRLSAEEQAFLDGPCETLCRMLDDFDITHRRGDLPPRGVGVHQVAGLLCDDHPEALRRTRVLDLCAFVRAGEARAAAASPALPRSRCRIRSARRNCWCTTAPRSRRTTTCRVWRAARRSRASR